MSEAEDLIRAATAKPTPRPKGTNEVWDKIVCAWLDSVLFALDHANLRMLAEYRRYEWASWKERDVKSLAQELFGAIYTGCKEAFDKHCKVEAE